MTGIGFADYINIALSADYLAFRANFLDRRLHFHKELYSNLTLVLCQSPPAARLDI